MEKTEDISHSSIVYTIYNNCCQGCFDFIKHKAVFVYNIDAFPHLNEVLVIYRLNTLLHLSNKPLPETMLCRFLFLIT